MPNFAHAGIALPPTSLAPFQVSTFASGATKLTTAQIVARTARRSKASLERLAAPLECADARLWPAWRRCGGQACAAPRPARQPHLVSVDLECGLDLLFIVEIDVN